MGASFAGVLLLLPWDAGAAALVYKNGRPVDTHSEAEASVRAAQRAATAHQPRGPAGLAAAHVFAFADQFNYMLCHLARSVEAAGGWLHVLGLRDGRDSKLPGGDVDQARGGSATRAGEPWHFADKSIMLKKHLFLARALRQLLPNSTVVFVDAFDVLFQRPLADLVDAYRRIAAPAAEAAGGVWPVVYGGEVNCWPFPHSGRVPVRRRGSAGGSPPIRVHEIPKDAALSAEHHAEWRYGYGDRSPWTLSGRHVCSEWLSQPRADGAAGHPPEGAPAPFPFLCAGTFVGTVSALRKLLRRLFALYAETREYHDQALIALLLLRNRSLGMVDTSAQIFLELHGHDEFDDLERPLCRGTHFKYERDVASRAEENQPDWRPEAPVPGYRATRSLVGLTPPALRVGAEAAAQRTPPAVLHFNGNGKRHLLRCVEEFQAEGVLGGHANEEGEGAAECTFFDHDRRSWQRVGVADR